MKRQLTKRIISMLLAIIMVVGLMPKMAFVSNAAASLDTENLKFNVTNPAGYVTVSFIDNGVRPEDANILDAELYGSPLGTIIPATKVPYQAGDNMADVTVRLLDAMGLSYDNDGNTANGFYLSALEDFELNGIYYESLGEFDAGNQSGWCVRLNNWHANQGASAFEVEDGDVISWLYTCQNGADVGADFSSKSAEITDVILADANLSLVYDEEKDVYNCKVSEDISSIAFEVELKNYASIVSVTVDGNAVKYRPNKAINVTKNSKIVIEAKLEYMDAANNNEVSTYTDSRIIQFYTETNQSPVVVKNAQTQMEINAGEEISVDLSKFFSDPDGDVLSYNVKIEALNVDQDVESGTFTGTIPAAGTYEVVVTASDGKANVSHTITLTATEASGNTAPNIKAEYAEEKGKTYVYSSSYVYIYMEDIFEDADGDALTYKATCNGEEAEVSYNDWSKEYYIQFATKPEVREYKIVANDGKADSEAFTAKCIGTSATITAAENEPLIENGNYYYYVKGSAENDTFTVNYKLDVDEKLTTEWVSSNGNVLTSNGDGSFTAKDVTKREQPYIGVTCGKDNWGSSVYLGTKYFYILPDYPSIEDITIKLPEHEDNVVATQLSNAVSGGWCSSEFDYVMENPEIANIEIYGSYGFKVTPKALGTTKVTATFKYDNSIKTTFNITVTGRSLQMQGHPDEDSVIFKDGKMVQMEVLGAVEGEKFTWTSSDETVATVNKEGLVTLKKLGPVYITAESSLSTESEPLKASMYLQIKEENKVYLDDIAMTDYAYFEGEEWISAKAGFHSAQLTYDWNLQESRYTYNKLAFTPYFDDEKLNAVLYYQVSGGEQQTKELANETAVSITNGLVAGENVVKIEVSSKDDADNVTTYIFNIFRPYNPTNTITRMTIYPNGDTALAYPKYFKNAEGTIFYNLDPETKEPLANAWGSYSTGWSSSQSEFKTYVFGDRTKEIVLYPTFGYTEERVMIYVDGEPFEEAVTTWKSNSIFVPAKGEETVITFHVNSEKYHVEQLAKGVKDPYEDPERVYTLYVENVTPLGINSKILSAELETGEFYQPGFNSDRYSISALIPNGQKTEKMTFTVADGIEVYKNSISASSLMTAIGKDEAGNNIYNTDLAATYYSNTYGTTNIILQVTDEETGEVGQTQYAFTMNQRGIKDVYPDEVVDYLCIGSQYTNGAAYGTMPERTLKDKGGTLSLGNFGGYVTYKYNTPIENSANNPYGVDFVIYGNSFGNGAHEPGYVQVSKDGKTWYTLAGASHYDDYCDWDYSMTYTNKSGKSAWTNSEGESGEIYNYPVANVYPYFEWTEELEKSMTVTGPRLNSESKDQYGSAAAALPVFGYVDVNTNGTISGTSNNPYDHPGQLKDGGDMFDLDWAVDEKGMPVELDSISYIRVATASSIYAGAIGEKSTEVATVNRVTNVAEEAVGKTIAPISIKVNGTAVSKTGDENVFEAAYEDGEMKVDVKVPEGTHVYINDTYGISRSYMEVPEKEIIRIIVQEGEKEPYIAYVTRKTIDEETSDTEKQREIYKKTGAYLNGFAQAYTPGVNAIGGDWMVLGLVRSGYDVPKGYYSNVEDYVLEEINDKEQLHRAKSTENSRVILALTAAGYDVTDVAGHNLLKGLTDLKYVTYQGINGAIWALIAFDSYNYGIPEGGNVTRETLIDTILDAQLADDGWALSGETADVDMTAMAIQALAPYYDTNVEVKEAVDKALVLLEKRQNEDGSFSSVDGKNAESAAQVIVALTALGINPVEDERFVKNGFSVVDSLCTYAVDGGGFAHLSDGKRDGMATEQGYYALTAYFRMVSGQTSLFDMSDVEIQEDGESSDPEKPSSPEKPSDPQKPTESDSDKESEKVEPEGGTKVIGNGDIKVTIDGVTYKVDKKAADLMKKISKLSKVAEPAEEDVIALYQTYADMSKKLKAQVFNYEDLEAMTIELGAKNHKDEATGMEAEGLEWNVRLVIEEVSDGKEYDSFAGSIGSNELITLWDISLVDILTGEEAQPDKEITIKAAFKDAEKFAELCIAHLIANGQMEYLDCEVKDGYVTWKTDSLSKFGLIGNPGEAKEELVEETDEVVIEETEDNAATPWGWIAGLGVGVAGLVAVIMKMKKTKEEEA